VWLCLVKWQRTYTTSWDTIQRVMKDSYEKR